MNSRKFVIFCRGLLICALVNFGVLCAVSGQEKVKEISILGGKYRLGKPAAIAISPSGQKMALSDQQTNRIFIIDLQGRLLWIAGEETAFDQPQAVCFLTETEVLFSLRDKSIILRVSRGNPSVIDTVADLTTQLSSPRVVDQMMRTPKGQYVVLDRSQGELLLFDSEWKYQRTLVSNGSGKGKVLAPSSFGLTSAGEVLVADEKNYPVQVFSPEGKFLFYYGWNQPTIHRGWEAVAVAVDTRGFFWVADETYKQFRIYDQSGGELSAIPFPHKLFRPAAMVGTADNHMVVLDETSTLSFFTLD
ncbi:MAG: hypothetical protein ACE5K8_02755 [Candidatus Zixiibacteriota bacterium]